MTSLDIGGHRHRERKVDEFDESRRQQSADTDHNGRSFAPPPSSTTTTSSSSSSSSSKKETNRVIVAGETRRSPPSRRVCRGGRTVAAIGVLVLAAAVAVAFVAAASNVVGFAPPSRLRAAPMPKSTSTSRHGAGRGGDAGDDVNVATAAAAVAAAAAHRDRRPRQPPPPQEGGRGGRSYPKTRSNSRPPSPSSKKDRFDAARAFNARLTTCDDAAGLLSAFVERTSSSPSDNDDVIARSAATHLAGAGRVNSVNFSTCLHRLAKIASANNNGGNSGDDDPEKRRARALSDPRFALLVCSMAEMACGVDPNTSVRAGNDILASWTKDVDGTLGGGSSAALIEDEMEEADDVLDAIANGGGGVANARGGRRRLSPSSSASSSSSLSSSRASLAREAMARLSPSPSSSSPPGGGLGPFAFSSRECSNVCWALAKLRLAPPGNGEGGDALPVGKVTTETSEGGKEEEEEGAGRRARMFVSVEEMSLDVLRSSMSVRMKLYDEARNRGGVGGGGGTAGPSWIPELSRLAGRVFDLIAVRVIDDYASRSSSPRSEFNPQEMASILWAFAKVRRGDDGLFDTVASALMRQTNDGVAGVVGVGGGKNGAGGGGAVAGPKPQELSNTIWAFATAGIRGSTQVELVKFIADALDAGDGQFFGHQFKPQERSNTAWALATLHSKRCGSSADGSDTTAMRAVEDDGIVRNMRWVAKSLPEHVGFFKPQELSNSVWAFSTVGFGYDESCGTNSHNDYDHVATDDAAGDKAIIFEALEVIAENALTRLDKFKAQGE